jgi:hypothetical protein
VLPLAHREQAAGMQCCCAAGLCNGIQCSKVSAPKCTHIHGRTHFTAGHWCAEAHVAGVAAECHMADGDQQERCHRCEAEECVQSVLPSVTSCESPFQVWTALNNSVKHCSSSSGMPTSKLRQDGLRGQLCAMHQKPSSAHNRGAPVAKRHGERGAAQFRSVILRMSAAVPS